MGWGDDQLWSAARAERPIDELTNQLPCDFLILSEHDLDTSRVLIPTSGGPDSDLSAEVARVLAETAGAEVTLLHVVDGPDDRARGEAFLASWADEHDLGDAELVVDDGGDVEAGIARAATDKTLVIIGATEKGLLSRLVSNSLHLDVINDVRASVLLTERPSNRSIRERLFGSGRRATDLASGVERDPERGAGSDVRSASDGAARPDADASAAADDPDGEANEPDGDGPASDAADPDGESPASDAPDSDAGDPDADAGPPADPDADAGPPADPDADGSRAATDAGPEDQQPHLDDTFVADHDEADEEAAADAAAERGDDADER
jgi:nucleotide-binding universal stress UspA family protein